ncbi:hypothetical protein [Streptomyces curacoi]|uniref:Uncharacterized protein n=1 Tax=Streptomyces curacoi TaxID=146536 RepID=A0A124H5A6_9ACTN|nr:hypothetical protein [Streptomyces curacoi]KUM79126.1 hypothetical protein AQI70_09740 [Streptomyces curacoi]
MSHHTPSQAEGEREDTDTPRADHPTPEYTTPSQAEGERDDAPETTEDLGGPDMDRPGTLS